MPRRYYSKNSILHVAVCLPLRHLFDYLLLEHAAPAVPGARVSIPFKNKNRIGVIVAVSHYSDYPLNKLKKINYLIDQQALLSKTHLQFIIWASTYYHHPIGEVIFNALPTLLRKGTALKKNTLPPQQTETAIPCVRTYKKNKLCLNKQQQTAVTKIAHAITCPAAYLLEGITGSGKTEVYMQIIELVIKTGKQCLILLPEIGLTPQLIQSFTERFNTDIAIQHSALTDTKRLQYWQAAASGQAKIILGTRSATWIPLANPGLYIVDEEHDLSYKQQDGLRYSARDMLVARARRDKVPIILGSATPSLESLHNVDQQRYQYLTLTTRAGGASLPSFDLLDLRGMKMHGSLSQPLVDQLKRELIDNNQVLLFLNRRGYASYLYCHECAWVARCPRCNQAYTYHLSLDRLCCHHCGSSVRKRTTCANCKAPLLLLRHGTEQVESLLKQLFPKVRIIRIDRDTTCKKGTMEKLLTQIATQAPAILIGTQMLAKGHHFPNVTLTAIIDADQGLFSADFRASERLAQLFIQISGRTGRAEKSGKVMVQTYHPQHPFFYQLINHGYHHFAASLQQERCDAKLPPYSYMAFLRVEAHNSELVKRFIKTAEAQLRILTNNHLKLTGPIPALIEKQRGRFRFQLIMQTRSRKKLHQHLDSWLLKLETMKITKKVRWCLDVDPQDMS